MHRLVKLNGTILHNYPRVSFKLFRDSFNLEITHESCSLCKRPFLLSAQIRNQTTVTNPNIEVKTSKRKKKSKKDYAELLVVTDNSSCQRKATVQKLTFSDLKLLASTNLNLSELYKLKDLSKNTSSVEEHTYNNLNIIENIPSINNSSENDLIISDIDKNDGKVLICNIPDTDDMPMVNGTKQENTLSLDQEASKEFNEVSESVDHELDFESLRAVNTFQPEVIEEHISDADDVKEAEDKKVKMPVDHARREEMISKTLAAYIEVCSHLKNPQRGLNALNFHRFKTKKLQNASYVPIRNIKVFNALLKGFAHKGDFQKILEVLKMMQEEVVALNVQSYAAIFECLGMVNTKDNHLKEIRIYAKEALSNGITFNKIMNEGTFLNNERDLVLNVMRCYDPNYVPEYDKPNVLYKNLLVNHLNDAEQEVPWVSSEEGSGDLIDSATLRKYSDQQIRLEKEGFVSVKSIESKGEITGYRLTPHYPYVICDTNWNPDNVPKCLKLCPPLYSTPTTTLKCKDSTGNAISCSEATDGTYLTYQCLPYYETLGRKQSLYCSRGSWDFPKPVCQPVCGKKVNNEVTTLVFGGEDTKKFEYPWVTAIYIKHDGELINNCGGTLINPRVVLTAAHCITNNYGDAISEDLVEVGVGKYFNKHSDARDIHAQYSKAARLIVHEEYRGDTRRYQYDIALIVTKKLFTLGPVVQPACYINLDYIYPHVGSLGEMAGWGIKEDGKPSDTLRTLKIPYKEKITCTRELPSEWSDRYNFDDKMCAGFYRQNKSVCQGDSGSGLVFRNPEDNRYYVHGVVSLSPKALRGACNSQDNALFTKVAHYYEWLDKKSTTNYVEECILPPYPKNGKWQLDSGEEMLPGNVVPSTSVLVYSCRQGYKLSTVNSKFYCGPSLQPPSCEVICTLPEFQPSSTKSCQNNYNQIIDCAEATHGTTLTYTCPQGYETLGGSKSATIRCIHGSWGSKRPECLRKTQPMGADLDDKIEIATKTAVVGTTLDERPAVEYLSGIKVICTYASWRSYHGVNPEDFDPSLCTHFVYDYIGVWAKGDLRIADEYLDVGLYTRVTDMKKRNRKLRVLLAVGGSGATNSSLFSGIAADASKTAEFVKSAKNFMNTYKFDGLEIDWFYPEEPDKENYITFLRKIKEEFDRHGWLLSASVRSDFEGTGYDPPKMNEILDWITVKSYDMYGSWSTYTGNHNALYPSSREFEWERNHLNMNAVANIWLKGGISKDKLVLSVAFYGRSFTLKDSNKNSVYSLVNGIGPGEDGSLKYSEICSKYNDYTEVWDDDEKSPYRYKGDKWFAYNSKEAVSIKGDYIKTKGFFGVNVWPIDADDVHGICGTKQALLKYLHEGLGNKVNFDK